MDRAKYSTAVRCFETSFARASGKNRIKKNVPEATRVWPQFKQTKICLKARVPVPIRTRVLAARSLASPDLPAVPSSLALCSPREKVHAYPWAITPYDSHLLMYC